MGRRDGHRNLEVTGRGADRGLAEGQPALNYWGTNGESIEQRPGLEVAADLFGVNVRGPRG